MVNRQPNQKSDIRDIAWVAFVAAASVLAATAAGNRFGFGAAILAALLVGATLGLCQRGARFVVRAARSRAGRP